MSTVRPLVNAWLGSPNGEIRLEPSQDWDADDPIVKANPDMFGAPVEPVVRRTIARRRAASEGGK